MADDIRSLSEELAADPSSLVFLPLAELLRQRGEMELAFRVATRGLERHEQRVDAHALVARIALDRGDEARARAEWERVLAIDSGHVEAHKGLGFLYYREGDLAAAERFLQSACTAGGRDSSLEAALRTVRTAQAAAPLIVKPESLPEGTGVPAPVDASSAVPGSPVEARFLFRKFLGDSTQTALLLDGEGYVIAGQHLAEDGVDASAEMGAHLSGVTEEANRAMRHLGLGAWRHIVFETETDTVAMAPSGSGVLLVTAPPAAPLGLLRRTLDRALEHAGRWLESGA